MPSFKCPNCGNEKHFMVLATLPVVLSADPGGDLYDFEVTAVVDTYESEPERVSLDLSQVMCMECSSREAFVGDPARHDCAVYAEPVK